LSCSDFIVDVAADAIDRVEKEGQRVQESKFKGESLNAISID
jgi:hypothetical protein